MIRILFSFSLLFLSFSSFSSDPRDEITLKEFNKKHNLVVLAVEIDSIVPTVLKNNVKEIKNFEEVEKELNIFLKNPAFNFFPNFFSPLKQNNNFKWSQERIPPHHTRIIKQANMCLTEFIFRTTIPETLEYPTYYLLRKMFRETALETGPFTIFLKALTHPEEKQLWDAYKKKKGKNIPHCIALPKFDLVTYPPSKEEVKVFCQQTGLFDKLTELSHLIPFAHMNVNSEDQVFSSITNFLKDISENRGDAGDFIFFFKAPSEQKWKVEITREFSQKLGGKDASRCWEIYHRRLIQMEHMADVCVIQALCAALIPIG